MIYLLFGNEGCGKSTYILNKIKEDANNCIPSFLIVPEQQTVISEKELATLLPPRAQLYCEAINFTRLANKLFREIGGLKYNYISKSGKSLAMYRTICECRNMLRVYNIAKGHEKSCVKLFLDAIGELKSYSVTPDSLENATQGMENDKLRDKLNDLLLIWTSYEKIMRENYSDPYDDILTLAEKLQEINYFKGKNVYIDAFYSFTKSQLDVIKHILKQAENVYIAFDCPINTESGAMQYAKITEARDKIIAICKDYTPISFDVDYKHIGKSIGDVCENIWNFSASPILSTDGIELIRAGDEFEECEYVASKIKEKILQGERYSDFAIIMRNSDTYRGIIDYCLDKFEIPYFYSTSVDITSAPVIKMIFSALGAISSYRCEDIISYIKCGYTDISENELNDLEGYMFRWNIYGKKFKNQDYWASNPDGYVSQPTIPQLQALASINNTRDKVIDYLSVLENAFVKNCTVRNASLAVFSFLEKHNLKEQLQKEIESCNSRRDAYLLSQVWNMLIASLDTLVKICGDAIVSVDDYITLLKYALSENKLGAIPTGEDTVIIGDAPTIRAKGIKHAFILGVNEGVFPAEITEGSFFTDMDKITLETEGISLSSKTDIRSDDELLAFRHALSVASDSVTVSALKGTIKGRQAQPSIAFLRMETLLGKDYRVRDTALLSPIDKIYTRENATELMSHSDKELSLAILECLEIENAPNGSFSNDSLSIDENVARELFGEHLRLSKSSIESFAGCKMKYYCDYVLGLKPSKRISFAANDIGTLNHLIIERFFALNKAESFDASTLTDKEIEDIIDGIISDYTKIVCGASRASNKLKYLFNKLKRSLVVYIKNLISELGQSDFTPEFFELSLSGNGIDAPRGLKFKIGENATASLVGTADRVDIYKKDGDTYVRIVDYKSGSERISREFLSQGFGLQLFIYLFTLCKLDSCEFKEKLLDGGQGVIKPAGIMYFPMNISKKTIDFDVDLSSPEVDGLERNAINERIERSGFFLDNIDILKAQDKSDNGEFLPDRTKGKDQYLTLEEFESIYKELEDTIYNIGSEILSGDASAVPVKIKSKPHPCDYCDNKMVCRRRK